MTTAILRKALAAFGLILGCAKPLPGALQSLFKSDARMITERLPRQGDVRLGIADVSFARRSVFCLRGPARNFFEQGESLIQRAAVSRADVDGEAGRALCLGGEQIRFHHVFHVDKVARLLAVAVHGGLRSPKRAALNTDRTPE